MWQEAARAQVAQKVDQLCPKLSQGLSTGDYGDYIRLATINRACQPVSNLRDFAQDLVPKLFTDQGQAFRKCPF